MAFFKYFNAVNQILAFILLAKYQLQNHAEGGGALLNTLKKLGQIRNLVEMKVYLAAQLSINCGRRLSLECPKIGRMKQSFQIFFASGLSHSLGP